ncbi:MAG: toll/interleukin-1 receptor domain-containing protein [Proteobacteria bacterium]|nr:toll/interleukin-1 receptor domain-containing protein [Pseudomonadota bacterium]
MRDERRKDGSLVRLIQCRWCGRSERVIDPEQFNPDGVTELSEKGVSLRLDEETWLESSEDVSGMNALAAFNLSILANFAEVLPFVVPPGDKNRDPQPGYALLMRTLELFIIQVFASLDLPTIPKSRSAHDLLHEMAEHKALPPKLLEEMSELMEKRGLFIHALESSVTLRMLRHDAIRVARIISWYTFEFERAHRVMHLDVPQRSVPQAFDAHGSRKLFLCYAREDVERALHLYRILKKRGHKPWMDKKDLLPGQNWEHEIEKAIRESAFFIACLSPASVSKRGFVQKEVRYALRVLDEIPQNQIFIIPVMLEPCNPPDHLRSLQWITIESREGLDKMFRAIEGVDGTSN